MASTSALFVAAPPPTKPLAGAGLIRSPEWRIPTAARGRSGGARIAMRASAAEKERATEAGIAAAAVAVAVAMMPEVAQVAQVGIPPSLKNFLLSIVVGVIVLGVIVDAVIAVANFDPVKRT